MRGLREAPHQLPCCLKLGGPAHPTPHGWIATARSPQPPHLDVVHVGAVALEGPHGTLQQQLSHQVIEATHHHAEPHAGLGNDGAVAHIGSRLHSHHRGALLPPLGARPPEALCEPLLGNRRG